ncbi:MAG: hypothetical protein ABMB14_10265 [Myxococcota bacterium]
MRAVWLAAWIGLAGCDGGTTTKDTGGGTSDAPTFTRVNDEVLKPSCAISACHAAGTTAPLELAAGSEHAALVGVDSEDAPGEVLVVAGDADASYLVAKLEDAAGIAGSPMPPPFGGLDPADIQLIRDWIDAGALDD